MEVIICIVILLGIILISGWVADRDTEKFAKAEQKRQQADAQFAKRLKPPQTDWQLPPEELFTISTDDFMPYAPYSSKRLKSEYRQALLWGRQYIEIPIADFEEAKDKYTKMRLWERDSAITCCRNNDGIAFEKGGKIEEAIKVYEENIELGFPAMHSYTRLMIIYRRLKDYDNEQRVIRRAIEVYEKAGLAADDIEKWKLRMEKSKLLQSKQTNKN